MDSNINTTQKTLAADDKSCDSSGSSSRKRSYEESTDSVQNNVKMFRLEAIFHPKFENENQNEKLIRAKMKSKVQSKQGYLEVSLKHSGSLLLWSGGRRFYSKNSTDNKFSLSGEIILRQHFRRAQASFQECSSFVENKRLTLSFEVVTSFLGDHGERPKRDFLILTAVADRNEERFYSTVELIEMAQRFRLPHNDVFVFSNDYSTEKLFGFYDESREVGLATPVIDTLTETSDYCVKSLYPHSIFQGEIIEGFVVRYVSYQKHICIEKLRDLEARSLELLDRIPPKHPDGWDMPGDDGSQAPSYLRVNLRELADCNDFEGRIRKVLQDAGDRSLLPVEKSKLPDMIAIAERLQDSSDVETKRIAKVLNTVRKINARVDFSVSRETVSKGLIQRRVCILHVAHDGSFQKFRTHMESRDMPLYRGFVITLVDDEYYLDPFNPTKSEQDDPQDDGIIPEESLMLKMKFLPYMIRTFCCRNALQFLKKGGEPTFLVNVSAQMRRWNISKDAFEKWKAFLKAWAFFMKNRLGVEEFSPTEKYLDHLEEFQELYASGAFDADTHTCDFSGIIVVVGPDDDLVARIVDFLASRLSGTRIVSGRSIDVDWDLDGTGFINRLALNDLGKMRQLMKTEGRKFLVRCGSLPNISEFASKNEKKLQGLWEGWKSITGIPSIDVDSDEVKEAELEIMFQPFIQKVKKEKTVPNHEQTSYPSLLAFFPMIPGCGKSSLVCSALPALSESVQRKFGRSCAVIVGDKTPGKFWAAVKKEMRNNHGVVIADKNAPVSSINAIADVCARGNTFGVPVLPDSSALQTTEVVGSRYPDGIFEESRVHFYPFSLSFLAVCLARVYQRPPYSHQGKLDVGQATRPGMILLRFFGFYRQISCDALVDSLESSFEKRGATMLKPIELPFFSDKIELHPEVDAILREGLQAQFGYEKEGKDTSQTTDAYLDWLEERMQLMVTKHSTEILACAVPLERAVKAFSSRITERMAETHEKALNVSTSASFIKLAAIDVDAECLHKILIGEQQNELLKGLFETVKFDSTETSPGHFIDKTHVTMLHWSNTSQKALRENFQHLCGKSVLVWIETIVWNDNIVAFGCRVDSRTRDGDAVPVPSSKFVHITFWLRSGSSAAESNELPMLVQNGKATLISWEQDHEIEGTISLWES